MCGSGQTGIDVCAKLADHGFPGNDFGVHGARRRELYHVGAGRIHVTAPASMATILRFLCAESETGHFESPTL
jgi:hypothetical protein